MPKLSTSTLRQRKAELQQAIKKAGSPYAAAKELGVTPSAIYERCHRYGIEVDNSHDLLPGEPIDRKAKKEWLEGKLQVLTVSQIARAFNRTPSAIKDRMDRYGIKHKAEPRMVAQGEPRNKNHKRAWLTRLLEQYSWNVASLAAAVNATPSALYQRIQRYGVKLPA